MKFSFIGCGDFGNSGWCFAKALETQGHKTKVLIDHHHVFEYPQQGQIVRMAREVFEAVQWSDCVHIIQGLVPKQFARRRRMRQQLQEGQPQLARLISLLHNKPTVVQYGGSFYRRDPAQFNEMWNPVADATIIHEGDLMGLGARNEHLAIPPVDTKLIQPRHRAQRGPLIVGHFPGTVDAKGTMDILPVLKSFGDRIEVRHSELNPKLAGGCVRVPWTKQIERMSECHVLVDQIQATYDGTLFGEWCSTACEASALGCITIANSLNPQHYERAYGRMPGIHICNNMKELKNEINRLLIIGESQLEYEQREIRKWVEDYHSFEASGRDLMARVYGPIMESVSA